MASKAFLMGFNTLDLRYAQNDVRLLSRALERQSFSVTVAETLDPPLSTKAQFIESFDAFLDSCGAADTVVVYFSGHAFAPKGELLLLLGSDLNRVNASSIRMAYVTAALENCGARNKLLILDCCHALAEIAAWRPPQSESFRILAASGRLERAKEIDRYEASFLTYQIARALTSEFATIISHHGRLTVNTLFSWVLTQASAHNSRGLEPVPSPKLLGDQGADFVLTGPSEFESSAEMGGYLRQFARCLIYCPTTRCSSKWPWCRPVVEIGPIATQYVVPRIKHGGADGTVVESGLDEYLAAWVEDESRLHLAMLGDSGIGKSSACIYLSSLLLQWFDDEARATLVPIYLSLDGLVRRSLLGSDVHAIIRDVYQLDVSPSVIDELVSAKLLLFILDGFDEIADRADHSKIVRNLHHLGPILRSGCKVVLTCRTHFFVNQEQLEQLLTGRAGYGTELYAAFASQEPTFTIAELLELSDPEIREIVLRSDVPDVDEVLSTIGNLYNLEDLARRPILLQMILRTLPALLSSRTRINRATLYGTYVDFWIRREMERVEATVDAEQKIRFIEHLAVEMWEASVGSLAYSDLQERVRREYSRDILALPDFYTRDYDTRIASFLNRDRDGSYKFMHRSFLEYFTARYIARQLATPGSNLDHWQGKWFDKEVARFLGEILEHPNEVKSVQSLVLYCLTASDRTLLWNALHVLSLLDDEHLPQEENRTLLADLVDRASREEGAVLLRQYCRVVAKFGDRTAAERLIERIIEIVSNDEEQNIDNNQTYVDYYYGRDAACSALLTHLATELPKYDRRLHIYVLGQLGETLHARRLEALLEGWDNPTHVAMAHAAMAQMLDRGSPEGTY